MPPRPSGLGGTTFLFNYLLLLFLFCGLSPFVSNRKENYLSGFTGKICLFFTGDVRHPRSILRILLVFLSCSLLCAQRLSDFATPAPLPAGSTLVIGFPGGYDRWDDEHRSVRQLVLKLRGRPGVYAESIGNHHRKLALTLIRRARPARIILLGQSWGGAAVVDTARDLQRLGIPVLLTLQVDSVGRNDAAIPANVRNAVNFYQHDLFTIQGRREIHAADPSKTQILGNFKFSYPPGMI